MKNTEELLADFVSFYGRKEIPKIISTPIIYLRLNMRKCFPICLNYFPIMMPWRWRGNAGKNTEWQVEKIWTSRVIGWIEDAVRRWEQLSVETDRSFEFVREQRILNMIRSRNDHESTLTNGSEEVSEDTKRIDSPKMSKDIIKDKNILIWLSVGLLASLVGYFGWKERIDEIEENSSRTINESFEISVPSNDLIVDDNWSQVAMLAAQDSADRVLGEKLVKEIEKMEKEISISQNATCIRK